MAPNATLHAPRLAAAKRAYTTRNVDLSAARTLVRDRAPRPGDVVLATVADLGHHGRIEQPDGRRATIHVGDEVVVAYGRRYAPDMFEAELPDDLGPCQLAAAGGVAGRVASAHDKASPATALIPAGLVADRHGSPLTLARAARTPADAPRPTTVVVTGTAMNAGKTEVAARLVVGLRAAGYTVGAAKVTGTGAGGDVWRLVDAGAAPVLDFVDAGHVSTAGLTVAELEACADTLLSHLGAALVDVAVVEVADGLFNRETAALMTSGPLRYAASAIVFACTDAAGAVTGATWLSERGLRPAGLGGRLSMSPLASREAEAATGLPVWSLDAFASADVAGSLVAIPPVGVGRPWVTGLGPLAGGGRSGDRRA
jgi:hypothetical protein